MPHRLCNNAIFTENVTKLVILTSASWEITSIIVKQCDFYQYQIYLQHTSVLYWYPIMCIWASDIFPFRQYGFLIYFSGQSENVLLIRLVYHSLDMAAIKDIRVLDKITVGKLLR